MRPSPRRRILAWGLSATLVATGALLGPPGARAQLATLATSPGDGGVSIDVDAYGAFGYSAFGNGSGGAGDAIYDPVGSVGPSSTSWESAVYVRMPPASSFLTIGEVGQGTPSGGLPDPGFLFQDGTTAMSAFSFAGVDWELSQSVQDLLVGGERLGTLLLQEYTIRNRSAATVSFDLVRYYEGDLFLGLGAGVPDGGGRLVVGSEELLFETDLAGEPAQTTNLIGITACGGLKPARGRYEVNAWPAFPTRITADMPLGDLVFNDGADADEFVDAGLDYDVGLALANEMVLAPGQALLYVTTTVFGTLPPDGVSEGCGLVTQAVAEAGPELFACPDALVELDGSASFDADLVDGGLTPSWIWDLDVAFDADGNGVPDDDPDALGEVVTARFPLGTTTVQLTYTDDDGDVDSDRTTVTVRDDTPPVLDCPAEVIAPALSFDGGPAAPTATAVDDCDPAPAIVNDRTAGGASAADDYPCGLTAVTFTARDALDNETSCTSLVRIVPDPTEQVVGAALRVTKPDGVHALLDWSLAGVPPPEVRFTVLRGELLAQPLESAPGADSLVASPWTDDDASGALVLYDVRTLLCDGSLSAD